jgi:hypothetical protein
MGFLPPACCSAIVGARSIARLRTRSCAASSDLDRRPVGPSEGSSENSKANRIETMKRSRGIWTNLFGGSKKNSEVVSLSFVTNTCPNCRKKHVSASRMGLN